MDDDPLDLILAGMPPEQRRQLDQEALRLAGLRRSAWAEAAHYDLEAPLCTAHDHDEIGPAGS